ncbi:hypothetical protein PILCRDRAFT_515545 [Piloderma croceum F 1598]|uniref:Uncharacterized protein n=1 Tax=Piloderma croceum (strain F 1598) TaxID=765440 RepID=A0A0C3BTW4_PILCF|nr:hypothetical protein PILCRDRAFT_515545 [Piloderma croceum F 1598]
MSGRPRHSLSASEDPYKIWRPQERQVESDSERPRYRTTNTNQSQRNQEEGRYYSSSRGYKSDSPTTASASQYRSGPSSSKPLHHPSRPSVSNNYVSRSQQPAASNSTTPTPQVQHHPRSQPQRSQPEAYSSRVYLHSQNTSTPTPQSSHERVPTADEFTKTSRSNPYSRTGYATQVPQPTSAPEVWLPSTHDPSLSRKPRDRDRERDRERDRDREKEAARDRNRERERPKDADRRRERDVERRDDVYREPSRDVYRDRDRDRDRARERERDKYQERRTEEEREPVSHRELRNTSKPISAQDTRTRDPTTTSTSNHRRHRSEEAPLSSATAWRPPIDSKQTPVTAPPAPKAAPGQTPSGGQANVPPPTPRVMPVYLPGKQPSAYKPSHERSYSTPAALAQKENSTSDSEQPSRRDLQSRTVNDSRLATTTSTIKDNGILRSQKDQTDRPPETTPPKSKHEVRIALLHHQMGF